MRHLLRHIALFALVLLLAACAQDTTTVPHDDPISDGCGRVSFRIGTSETFGTRGATGSWLDGLAAERAIQSYVVLICNGNTILQVIQQASALTEDTDQGDFYATQESITSKDLPAGNYNLTFYCLANFTAAQLQQAFGSATLPADGAALPTGFEAKPIQMSNTTAIPTGGIPMTGKLEAEVQIRPQQIATKNTSDVDLRLMLWRMMAKLELDFVNESEHSMDIRGIEIEPINSGTVGTPLWQTFKNTSSLDLYSTVTDAGKTLDVVSGVVNDKYTISPVAPAVNLVSVPAKSGSTNGTGTFTAYLNETDASYTAVNNQFSLRFMVFRNGTATEYRYAITTPYTDGSAGGDGFNVIRRNDWIKLPIHFTPWQFQIEVLPFPPIAGFQARMVTGDAQSVTFDTGGYIILTPRFRKAGDPAGVWRGLDDGEITLTLPTAESAYNNPDKTATHAQVIAADGTGIVLDGDIGIFEQFFVKHDSGDFVGKLDNANEKTGTVTVTLKVKLGAPPAQYDYQFTYNIIKKS